MKNVFFFTVVTLFVVLSIEGNAQIPRTLSYQGVLTDSSGNPKPDNTYSLTFRLYEDALSGIVLWTEVKSLEVKRGLFSTILGDLTPLPDSLKFDRPYWLSIQVASEAELIPRIPLTPVGYSLHSVKADTANYAMNMPLQMVVDSARIASTVPDNSITSAKIVDGSIQRIDVDPSFSAPFSDTANYARQIPSINFVDSARIAGTIPDSTITRRKIPYGQVIKSLNAMADNITLSATGGATITSSNDTIIINAGSGGGGTGVQGVQNTNNTLDITNPNGPTVTVNVKDNLYLHKQGPDTITSTTGSGLTSMLSGSSTSLLSGFYGTCNNTSSGIASGGVFSAGAGGTGIHNGVEGRATSSNTLRATGVYGYGMNYGSGEGIGVYGIGYSTGDEVGGRFSVNGYGNGPHTGVMGMSFNHTSGTNFGGLFQAQTDGSGYTYGVFAAGLSTSSEDAYGIYSRSIGHGTAYGGYFTVDSAWSGNHYGIFATVNNQPNSYAGYFDGRGYFSGNVGIGNINPSYSLDVAGTVKADTFSGDGSLLTNIHTSDWNGGGSPSALLWRTGSVGIGTSTPGAGLVVSGSGLWGSALGIENTTADIEWRLATTNDSSFHFVKLTGVTITPLTLAANGNVGIGVSPPTKKLDVNGPTHIKDTIAVGSPTQNGTFQLYRNGASFPVVWMENFSTHGGRIVALDEIGVITGQLRPSSSGTGGTLELYRNTTGGLGFYATGNVDGTQQGYMSVNSASRSAVFNMGASGNSSVQLPDNSISAAEILDEPGIAHNLSTNSVNITGNSSMVDIDTVSITIPSAGYIYVHARAMAYFSGTINGNHVLAQIDTTQGGSWIPNKHTEIGVDIASTGASMLDLSVQQVFFKQAGTYTFRLEAMPYFVSSGGSENIYYPVITAIYFPTSYGAVTTVVSGSDAAGFNASPVSVSSPTTPEIPSANTNAYQVDLRELELKATKARLAAEEAERKLMEAKMEYNQHNSDDKNK